MIVSRGKFLSFFFSCSARWGLNLDSIDKIEICSDFFSFFLFKELENQFFLVDINCVNMVYKYIVYQRLLLLFAVNDFNFIEEEEEKKQGLFVRVKKLSRMEQLL